MQTTLSAKNKMVIVNGIYAKPDHTSAVYYQWECVNDILL